MSKTRREFNAEEVIKDWEQDYCLEIQGVLEHYKYNRISQEELHKQIEQIKAKYQLIENILKSI